MPRSSCQYEETFMVKFVLLVRLTVLFFYFVFLLLFLAGFGIRSGKFRTSRSCILKSREVKGQQMSVEIPQLRSFRVPSVTYQNRKPLHQSPPENTFSSSGAKADRSRGCSCYKVARSYFHSSLSMNAQKCVQLGFSRKGNYRTQVRFQTSWKREADDDEKVDTGCIISNNLLHLKKMSFFNRIWDPLKV